MIRLDNELKLHIKKLQNRTPVSIIAFLSAVISIAFGIMLIFVELYVAIVLFAMGAGCIMCLIYCNSTAKREQRDFDAKPCIFKADVKICFDKIKAVLEKNTDAECRIYASENLMFFRINKIFKLRTILYRTEDFDSKIFKSQKDLINKQTNKKLNISPWVNRYEAVKMMRFNIIYTDMPNETLYRL